MSLVSVALNDQNLVSNNEQKCSEGSHGTQHHTPLKDLEGVSSTAQCVTSRKNPQDVEPAGARTDLEPS